MTQLSPCCGVVPSDIRWKRIDDSPWPTRGRMVMALDPAMEYEGIDERFDAAHLLIRAEVDILVFPVQTVENDKGHCFSS
jgi:hypothetical protein